MPSEFGDFQTPLSLVQSVLQCLASSNVTWTRALEPTCGTGTFIEGLLNLPVPPSEIQAVEIQEHHYQKALAVAASAHNQAVNIRQASIFELDLSRDLQWKGHGPLLVVGNPPWITNTQLATLDSKNVPLKSNIKNLRGIDALTGGSNFDIAEYIWLKLIWELAPQQPTIALLCKTSVARNVLQFAFDTQLPISNAFIRRVDAKKWFGASVDACLFCVQVGGRPSYDAEVYGTLTANEPDVRIGIRNARLVADVTTFEKLAPIDGSSLVTWRQGLKHDAVSLMELSYDKSRQLRNAFDEIVNVEPGYVYPLLKSSDLPKEQNRRRERSVIVPQKYLGEDTRLLEAKAPKLWHYLSSHSAMFASRKSSIYTNQPPFAVFGIGEYSFSPYKVAISGMYKSPHFRALGPVEGRPVFLDDTCYFISCATAEEAAFFAALLNSGECVNFLQSVVFSDSKRPITKKLLQRIDLKALFRVVDAQELFKRADSILYQISTVTHSNSGTFWSELARRFLHEDAVA